MFGVHALRKARTPIVIHVDDGVPQARRGEQPVFRLGVSLHGAVVIEVVAREVGEDRDVVLDARDAALVEAVARHLHRDAARAAAQVIGEQALQHDRVRGGVLRLDALAHEAVAERADDRRAPAQAVEGGSDPLRHRGLAVGARHARHPQRFGGIAEHVSRDLGDLRAQVLDAEVGHFPALVPFEAAPFPEDRGGAARERFGDVGAPVARGARIGDEDRAELHAARVRGDVRERNIELREAIEKRHAGGARKIGGRDHPGTPVGVACTFNVPGASGGTAIMRRAAPITEENTGAPTSPP